MDKERDRDKPSLISDLFGPQASVSIPQGQFGVWSHDGPWAFRGRVRASEIWFTAILVMMAAVVFRLVFHTLDDAAAGFVHSVPSAAGRDAIGVVVLATVGYLLSVLRAKRRLLYAVVELGAAVAVAWSAAARMGIDDRSAWVAPLSAAYLFVRGIENFKEGLALTREDPLQPVPEPNP
jgi:hypothetical protein